MLKSEWLAQKALSSGDFQEAVNLFKRAMEEGETSERWFGLAIAFENLQAWPEARWASYKALDLDPADMRTVTLQKRIAEQEGNEKKVRSSRGVNFRVHGDQIQIKREKKWEIFIARGINLGSGLPGSFPGEFAVMMGTYLKWFAMMQEAGFNSVRIYTLHPPAFYRALAIHNQTSAQKLYLIQGIWLELPEDNDFNGVEYTAYVREQIYDAVDAIYGNLTLSPKRGHPEGHYGEDVSLWIHSFLLGREWETCSVTHYNTKMKNDRNAYFGEYIAMSDGTPFERWMAMQCDAMQCDAM